MTLNRTFSLRSPKALAELRRAYANALYQVGLGPGAFVLRIGRASPLLRRLLKEADRDGAVGLTAYNPGGRIRDSTRNRAAQRKLRARLERGAVWILLEGENLDPAGLWPPEKSLWVLGMGRAEGVALAREFGQKAVLYVRADAVPRLAFC